MTTPKIDTANVDRKRVSDYLRHEYQPEDMAIGSPEWADKKAELFVGLNKDEHRLIQQLLGDGGEGSFTETAISMHLMSGAEKYVSGEMEKAEKEGEEGDFVELSNGCITKILKGALMASASMIGSVSEYADEGKREKVVKHAFKTLKEACGNLLNEYEEAILDGVKNGIETFDKKESVQ